MEVGVLGGGQLGRMLALAGYPLGVRCIVYDPAPDACAGQVAPHLCAPFDDADALVQFAKGKQVITYEFENVPVATARLLEAHAPVRPTPRALELFQDRLLEKQFLYAVGIPTPAFAPVDPDHPDRALSEVGCPCVVKTRRGGYDGKGQIVAHTPDEYLRAVAQLGSQPLIVEAFAPFEREVSVIGVRGRNGETRVYPLVENHHRDGILRLSIAPAPDSDALLPLARGYIERLTAALDYVGVLALELFQVGNQLLANEVAPRVHNSGHWTIEGAHTSQFENHLRAILGLPLGGMAARGVCAMVNLIGAIPPLEPILRIEGAHLHLYGKSPRAGRKVGHITLCADGYASLQERLSVILPR
ncbi:MAG: 5-(carboxyamino)imidazole ribonucleotide synthase [Fimbriimonadales bacterium]|nr:MAG: N5-carboxyaminoimidazole ribonucleotide synthase [Fimbriimonadales bacterium]